MAVITEDMVRVLASLRTGEAPVTSCYLDVDGRHLPTHRDLQRAFATLVRRAGLSPGAATHPSVTADVGRMERLVRGYGRSDARGLAMFSCTADGFWEVHELPVPVANQLVVNARPCVRQLEHIVTHAVRLAALVSDRQRARVFLSELGAVTPAGEVVDGLVRHPGDARGELVKTRVASAQQEQARQHVKRAAGLAFEVFQSTPFDHLVIATPTPDIRAELEAALHPYLRERLAGTITLPLGATDDQARLAMAAAHERVERTADAALVQRLRDALGARAAAVAGLVDTLAALCERRVERLLVSRGVGAEGWQCRACGCLATVGRRCPSCGTEMAYTADVLEEAVESALAQSCRVDVLAGNADLDVLGGVGALLRY